MNRTRVGEVKQRPSFILSHSFYLSSWMRVVCRPHIHSLSRGVNQGTAVHGVDVLQTFIVYVSRLGGGKKNRSLYSEGFTCGRWPLFNMNKYERGVKFLYGRERVAQWIWLKSEAPSISSRAFFWSHVFSVTSYGDSKLCSYQLVCFLELNTI